jgi:hypothetical protein
MLAVHGGGQWWNAADLRRAQSVRLVAGRTQYRLAAGNSGGERAAGVARGHAGDANCVREFLVMQTQDVLLPVPLDVRGVVHPAAGRLRGGVAAG